MLSKNPETLVFVVDFVVHDGSLQLGLFATWAWNKKKSYGDNGFGNLYRLYITIHEGSALTEDQRGTGLLCFFCFFFSLRHLHFLHPWTKRNSILIFAIFV